MGKVEDALRDLIYYHGKRAASEVMGDLPDQVREARRQLRGLQRDVEEISSKVSELAAARRRSMAVPPAEEEEVEKARFNRRTLKSLRNRFDLTQQELAELLEVSPVTVTSWETGKSKPRKSNLAQIITLRSMDQEEVDEALDREHIPASISPSKIKSLRSKLNLSQAELADLVGVSSAAVTSWETEKTQPSRENRKTLAELMEADRGEIDARLGRVERPAARAPSAKGGLSGDEIRQMREQAGLSQRELAENLGVSANTISNWETGRTIPRRGSMEKLLSMKE